MILLGAMSTDPSGTRTFTLVHANDGVWARWGKRTLEALMGIGKMNRFLAPLSAASDDQSLFDVAERLLEVKIAHSGIEHLKGIDFAGGCIMVANHPHGLLDMFATGIWVSQVTQQPPRFLGNQIIGQLIPEAKPYMIPVNNMGRASEGRRSFNRKALETATQFLNKGGVLGICPAGEVASLRLRSPEGAFKRTDHAWNPSFVSLARDAGVPIVPIHVSGGNRWTYYALRLFGRPFGRMANFRELVASKGRSVHIRVGEPLMPAQLVDLSDEQAIREARRRLYAS